MNRLRRTRVVTALFLWVTCAASFQLDAAGLPSLPASPSYLQEAGNGIQTLQGWYMPDTGLYRSTGWWNAANAITVLVNYSRTSKSSRYLSVLANTFTAAQNTSKGFLNNYYDDDGWWALAWIDAYDLTKDPRYLEMARSIFTDMSHGWDTTTCGGGIWWSKDKTYKNAIANELFLSVATHLANRSTDPAQRASFEDWSRREWSWFKASGMINTDNLVNDGLNSANPAACKNNGKTTWSYNQGVILGGLSEFSDFDRDPALLSEAKLIAGSAISHLTDSFGVLHDSCEPKCGGDGPQFKGVFVRNLTALYTHDPEPSYKTFTETNASSIWNHNQGTNTSFGLIWSGPFDSADAARQSSALDTVISAATLEQVSLKK